MRGWRSLFLALAVVTMTALPAAARNSTPNPMYRPLAGCNAPDAVRKANLATADKLADAGTGTGVVAGLTGSAAALSSLELASADAAGKTAAAALATQAVTFWTLATVGLAVGAAAIFGTYVYYKYTKDDPPDPHYMEIATPRIRTTAVELVPGMTEAEVSAINALAANTQQLLAVTRALVTTTNRTSGAAAAGQSDAAQRQTAAAKQYALRLAGLLDAQPALRAGLRKALAADVWFPANLRPGPEEVRAFQSQVGAHGLPALTTRILKEMGLDTNDLAQIRASITSANPAAVAAISYPSVLTDPRIDALVTQGANLWRQFGTGACRAPSTPATPVSPTGQPTLVLGDVVVDPAGYDHTGWDTSGAQGGMVSWKPPWGQATYEFRLPAEIGDAGGDVTLHIRVMANKGSRFAPAMGVIGEFDYFQKGQGVSPPGLGVLAESGETKDGSITFTLKHRDIAANAKEVLLRIGIQDGPSIWAHYKVKR